MLIGSTLVLGAFGAPVRPERRDYNVGPGQDFATIGATPLAFLEPGDTIRVHPLPDGAAYHEKFVLSGPGGSEAAPVTLQGVPDPVTGALPVVDGVNAVAPTNLNWPTGQRSLVQVGGANVPAGVPTHIIIDSMRLQNAKPPATFTHWNGEVMTYAENAACVWIQNGGMITIRNSELYDCGNLIFITGPTGTHDIFVEGNHIRGGGIPASSQEHNTYTEALGLTFSENFFDLGCAGCQGSNLKDRSGGLTVRNNWFYGGNRNLDLVDSQTPEILGDPRYRDTYVYGNVLMQPIQEQPLNRQMVHYGGDSGNFSRYRKGTLHLYYNTIVSYRPDATTLIRLSSPDETADVVNNIVVVTEAGSTLEISADLQGTIAMGNNFLKPGWVDAFTPTGGGSVTNEDSIEAEEPGFADPSWETTYDFELASGSPCVAHARPLQPDEPPPELEYVRHQQTRPRLGILDLGAFEHKNATQRHQRDFNVGPGQDFAAIGDTPLANLEPGDTIRLHPLPDGAAYHEKFVLSGVGGSEASPVTLQGVPDPATGALPVIDAIDAVTPTQLHFTAELRSVIQVGAAVIPAGVPSHITIDSVRIQNARPPYRFTRWNGIEEFYADNAACIWIHTGSSISVRNSELHNCGNGLFIGGNVPSDILIEGNHIWGGGIPFSPFEHNSYTSALGITFTGNFYDVGCADCLGSNLKDRSAGVTINYNWFYGGNRNLDLVDSGSPEIYQDPSYRDTYVYGNVLMQPIQEQPLNRQMVHYGGDSGNFSRYRKGTLHLYYNTIVSYRPDATTLLLLDTNDESADVVNNIILTTAPGSTLEISASLQGQTSLENNFIKPGWFPAFEPGAEPGTVTSEGNIELDEPGFLDPQWATSYNFDLAPSSPCVGHARPLEPGQPVPEQEYVRNEMGGWGHTRPRRAAQDLGALESVESAAQNANLTAALSPEEHRAMALEAWRRWRKKGAGAR